MKISKEVKVAIIVIIGSVLLISGVSYLKSAPLFKVSKTYYVVYNDIDGLKESAIVTLNGLKIGVVKGISFFDKTGRLLIELSINNDFNFSKNSVVELVSMGIIGGKSLRLIPVFDQTSLAKNGDTLVGRVQKNFQESLFDQVTPTVNKLEKLVTTFETTLNNVNAVLSTHNQMELNLTLQSLRKISENTNTLLQNTKQSLIASVKNIEHISENLVTITNAVNQNNLTSKAGSVLEKLDSIMGNLNGEKGSAGKFIRDPLLYNNLTHASKELELLLKDLRQHPKRYIHFSVFGRKDKSLNTQ